MTFSTATNLSAQLPQYLTVFGVNNCSHWVVGAWLIISGKVPTLLSVGRQRFERTFVRYACQNSADVCNEKHFIAMTVRVILYIMLTLLCNAKCCILAQHSETKVTHNWFEWKWTWGNILQSLVQIFYTRHWTYVKYLMIQWGTYAMSHIVRLILTLL